MIPLLTPGHIIKLVRLFLVVQYIDNRSTISDYHALNEGNGYRFYSFFIANNFYTDHS